MVEHIVGEIGEEAHVADQFSEIQALPQQTLNRGKHRALCPSAFYFFFHSY